MFIEVTQMRPRRKITVAISDILRLVKSETQKGTCIILGNGAKLEVFEFYRITQWLITRARRTAVASFSLKRDKIEWEAWCVEYMGDQSRAYQQMFDDCNFVHPTDVEEHEILSVDEDGCVKYADGSHGWVYSYLIGDIHIRKDGSQEVKGPYRQVYGINHKPKIKITETGDPISDSLPNHKQEVV